jgi:hypothetical protein
MPSSDEKSWFVPLIVITFLAIVVGVLYYISTDFYKQQHSMGRKEFDYGGRPVQSTATTDQVILTKNEKFVIGRTCLVFRGVEKKRILVDLYLLDLDPQQAYEKRISKKDAKKELLLGEGRYRLISINDQHLILKILH